jgi:hypothetical protein
MNPFLTTTRRNDEPYAAVTRLLEDARTAFANPE